MTRHVIATEGKIDPMFSDRLIISGAVTMPDEEIPVSLNYRHDLPPIGVARDFQRDEATGEISVDIELNDDVLPIKDYLGNYGYYLTEVKSEKSPAVDSWDVVTTINSARLRSVSAEGVTGPNLGAHDFPQAFLPKEE